MLSERVLDELVRRSELSEALCQALWPELAVESKLQLLAAIHAGSMPSTPDWLIDLALEDKSPVVQYFSLRHAYLRTRREDLPENLSSALRVSDEDVARRAKAHAITHPLVQAAVSDFSTFSAKEYLLRATQLERLVKVRTAGVFSLSTLADFLDEALETLPDLELSSVVYEYFMRPDTKRAMQMGEFGFADGESAYHAGEGLKKAWAVACKAGPALAYALASNLPTCLGMATLQAKDLAAMPERVLDVLTYDHLRRKEVSDLHRLIREQPGRFPEKVVETLANASEYARDEEAVVQRETWTDSPLSERATLEAVLALQEQVAQVAEQLKELRENPPKRGIFG